MLKGQGGRVWEGLLLRFTAEWPVFSWDAHISTGLYVWQRFEALLGF